MDRDEPGVIWALLGCAVGPRMHADVLASELAAHPEKYVVVDVRSDAEWKGGGGHIAGALHYAYPDVKSRGAELPVGPDQTLVLICLTGHRSQWAMPALKETVHAPITDLKGGMVAWWLAGLPTVVEPE